MPQPRSARYLLALAALAAFAGALATPTAQAPAGRWWTGYGNGPDNSRYFPSTQITRRNVTGLQVAWTYPFGDAGSSPIVVDGVIYGRGRNGSLVALDAVTGRELWVHENMRREIAFFAMNIWLLSGSDREMSLSSIDSRSLPRAADRLLDRAPRSCCKVCF